MTVTLPNGKRTGRKKISEGGTLPVQGIPHRWKPGQIGNNPNGNIVYDDNTREEIIDLIWSGKCKSIAAVERMEGMPSARQIQTWRNKYPEFDQELTRACLSLGDRHLDSIHTITDKVIEGTIEPAAASVAIRSHQWMAQVTDPRNYSSRAYVEKTENVNVKTTHVNRIDIRGLSEEQRDALEDALRAQLLLTGPDGGDRASSED